MMRNLLVLVGLLLFSSNAFGETVRILTYNIHHAEGVDGVLDLERIARVIERSGAAVVCLQEVDRNLPRTKGKDFPAWFSERLKMGVVFEANYRFDGGEYGNATLVRGEVLAHENLALPGPVGAEPRGCLRARVRVDGKELTVWNTHLGLLLAEREEQTKAILDVLPEGPVLLAGDMNEVPEGPPIQRLLSRFVDTLPLAAKGEDAPVHTVRGRRIDYIFAAGGFRVVDARIMADEETRLASDHLPYWVEVALP